MATEKASFMGMNLMTSDAVPAGSIMFASTSNAGNSSWTFTGASDSSTNPTITTTDGSTTAGTTWIQYTPYQGTDGGQDNIQTVPYTFPQTQQDFNWHPVPKELEVTIEGKKVKVAEELQRLNKILEALVEENRKLKGLDQKISDKDDIGPLEVDK